MKPLRLLLPLFLLLAVAAPVAAVEEPTPSVEPVPALYAAPTDPDAPTIACPDELAAAVALGEPVVVAEACLLPDGSVLPINVMTIAEPMPIDAPIDAPLELLACPEGIDAPDASISSDTVLPCLLPDGSTFPVAMPVMANDGDLTMEEMARTTGVAADGDSDTEMGLALYALFAGLGVAAAAGALIIRRKRLQG